MEKEEIVEVTLEEYVHLLMDSESFREILNSKLLPEDVIMGIIQNTLTKFEGIVEDIETPEE